MRLEAEVVTHDTGCLQLGQDRELTVNSLVGAASNPNVGAVLLVGLGCEQQPPEALLNRFDDANLEYLTIQGSGGTEAAIAQGEETGRRLQATVSDVPTGPLNWSDLTVAFRASDELESTSANLGPLFGRTVDELLDRGATVIMAETWPYIGLGADLLERFDSPQAQSRWIDFEESSLALLSEGGWTLDTLLQRSGGDLRGSASRLGSHQIMGLLEYGERPPGSGLWMMKTPREDIFAGPGILTAGAHLLVHGSSRGNLYSPPILPVLKVSGDSQLFRLMPDVYDIDVASQGPVSEAFASVLTRMEEVITGTVTNSEIWKGQELAIPRIGATL